VENEGRSTATGKLGKCVWLLRKLRCVHNYMDLAGFKARSVAMEIRTLVCFIAVDGSWCPTYTHHSSSEFSYF